MTQLISSEKEKCIVQYNLFSPINHLVIVIKEIDQNKQSVYPPWYCLFSQSLIQLFLCAIKLHCCPNMILKIH